MRKFVVVMEGYYHGAVEEEFELEDSATEEEIEAAAQEVFYNYHSFTWSEIEEVANEKRRSDVAGERCRSRE